MSYSWQALGAPLGLALYAFSAGIPQLNGEYAVARGSLACAEAPCGTTTTKVRHQDQLPLTFRIRWPSARVHPASEKTKMFIAMNRFKVIKKNAKPSRMCGSRGTYGSAKSKASSPFTCCVAPNAKTTCFIHRTRYGRRKKISSPGPNPEHFRAAHQQAGERKPLTLWTSGVRRVRSHPERSKINRIRANETRSRERRRLIVNPSVLSDFTPQSDKSVSV